MGKIITFYSYKGGVGRSMCLANIGILLARWEYKVLLVDWDLEAPGLENFFTKIGKRDSKKNLGLIDLLIELAESKDASDPIIPLTHNWNKFIQNIPAQGTEGRLDMMTAGRRNEDYNTKVRNFDVKHFYSDKKGGRIIEKLRNAWKDQYDYILVDSRTGITDIGGICTIQLPDILVLLFTPTEQGFRGIGEVANKVLNSQKNLPLDRLNLLLFPILTRIDGNEKILTKEWIEKFIAGSENLPLNLAEIYKPWLPERIDRKAFVQQVLVPYVAYYSFGEGLPVNEEGYATDVQGMGYAYESITACLATHLNYPHLLLDDRSKLLKLANKKSVKELRDDILYNVKQEIFYLDFTAKAKRIVKQFHANASYFSISGNEELINIFQEIVKDIIPTNNVTLSDILKIKNSKKIKNKNLITEEYTEWLEEDPIDILSDHIAIKIYYKLKDVDRDIIQSLKDDIGKSIINNISSSIVFDGVTLSALNNLSQAISQYVKINNNEIHLDGQGKDNIQKQLKLLQLELSRGISDKLFYLINDSELLTLGNEFEEAFFKHKTGEDTNSVSNIQNYSKKRSFNLYLIVGLAIFCLITLIIFIITLNKSEVENNIINNKNKAYSYAAGLKDSADEFSIYGDSINAKIYYKKAVDQALAVQDTNYAIQILKDQSITLSDSSSTSLDSKLNQLLIEKYNKPLCKVEIFYVDSLYEKENNDGKKFQEQYAEIIAEQLLRELSKQSNYVVKKRLFRPKNYSNNPYLALKNEIRYEPNREKEEALQIIKIIDNSRLKEKNILFEMKKVVSYQSPNYISIILINSSKNINSKFEVKNNIDTSGKSLNAKMPSVPVSPPIIESEKNKITSNPLYRSSGWFKEGNILRFINIRITLTKLDTDEKYIKITVCEQEDNLRCRQAIGRYRINIHDNLTFNYNNNTYKIRFYDIGRPGRNPLKRAAYISFEKF